MDVYRGCNNTRQDAQYHQQLTEVGSEIHQMQNCLAMMDSDESYSLVDGRETEKKLHWTEQYTEKFVLQATANETNR